MRFSLRISAISTVAALALVAGCTSTPDEPEPTSTDPTTEEVAESAEDLSEHISIEGQALEAPEFVWLNETPPAGLIVDVLEEGDGEVVPEGGFVKAHYEGRIWGSDEAFDSSYAGDDGRKFPLDGVVEGWRQGMPGNKVGSRLLISIPSELGYPAGQPSAGIEPGDTIVFVVDLLATDELPAADAVAENAGVTVEDDSPITFVSQEGEPADFIINEDGEFASETGITLIEEGTGPELEPGDWVAIAYSARDVGSQQYFSTWEIADVDESSGQSEVAIIGEGTIVDLAMGQHIGSRVLIEIIDESGEPVVFVIDLLAGLLTD